MARITLLTAGSVLAALALAIHGLAALADTLPAEQPKPAQPKRPPNIVLIMADDLGYECLACNGGTSYQTPHLDALAKSGTRFTSAYCTPLCSPSRVQLMTGRYPFRTGWTRLINSNPAKDEHLDPAKETTFARLLKLVGYVTGVVGKWQLCFFESRPDHPQKCGFDESCLWSWQVGGKQTRRYWDPSIHENGKVRGDVAGRYGPDVFNEFCVKFMERHKEKPFFLYYPMVLTHAPFEPTPDQKKAKPKPDPANFAAMVAYMDKEVGQLVAALERLKLREDTLILFTGDNGTPKPITSKLGNATIPGGKGTMTDAGTHVPLLANWPGTVPAGRVCADLIDFSDFFPTFAELSGAPLPKGVTLDGRSFAPQLRGQKGTPREWIFSQLGTARMAFDGRWQLHEDGSLYDVPADRFSEKKVAPGGSAAADAARGRLQKVLDQLR